MKTVASFKTRFAADAIASGGVIAYPSEAVWGLGCDPENPRAVQRLLQLKSRPASKGLILVAADFEQLHPYLDMAALTAAHLSRMQASWPGPVTWLVPAAKSAPAWLTGGNKQLAVRVSAHQQIQQLCRLWGGPIVSTSANPAARAPAKTPLRLAVYFGDRLDAILPGKLGPATRPTEIRDLISGDILRAG